MAEQVLPVNRLRELSIQISEYLQSSWTANTSYVASVRLSGYQAKLLSVGKTTDPSEAFSYNGNRERIFMRTRSPKILETVRLCYPDGDSSYGGLLTSLPIFGDISRPLFDVLSRLVSSYISQKVKYSRISQIFRREDEESIRPKAQLLTFLYSILSLADFCRHFFDLEKSELYRLLVSGDLNKILSNFDKGDIFRYEILNLIRDICMNKTIGAELWDYLDHVAKDITIGTVRNGNNRSDIRFRPVTCSLKKAKLYEDAEDIFYEVGMDAEYDAYQTLVTRSGFDTKHSVYDLISLRQYLRIMLRNENTFEQSIGAMFGLMDAGLIAMNLDLSGGKDEQTIQTVLKAGELATYVLPRRFSVFIPALAKVENHFSQVGRYVRDVIGDFISFLQDYCYSVDDQILLKDEVLLKELMRKKPLLLHLYSVGQTFSDWNIDLRIDRSDLSTQSEQNQMQFTYTEEKSRKKYYSNVASLYLIIRGAMNDDAPSEQMGTKE